MKRRFINFFMLILLFVLLVATSISCVHHSEIRDFVKSCPQVVEVNYYPNYISQIPPEDSLMKEAVKLRKDIEREEVLMEKLVQEKFGVKVPIKFRYQFAGYDSSNRRLVLSYFAKNYKSKIIAGWKVFWVYSLPQLRLEKVYIQEVPFE